MADNLTKRTIDSLRYEGHEKPPGVWSRCVRWDGTLSGFGVRVYPPDDEGESRKSFVLSYRVGGRKRMMVIGRYGAMTLDQARKRAEVHLVAISDGINPLEERSKGREKRTFGEFRNHFIEQYAKLKKKTWRADENRLNRHIPKRWDSRLADDISADDIKALHDKIGVERAKPYEANRLLEILRKMFKLARGPGWRFVPEKHPNPTSGIEKFSEKKRKRWATEDEVKALAKAIQTEPNIYIRGAIWLYLLTGLRKTELLCARRDEIDWSRKMLKLPETKSGEEQEAALNSAAVAIMQSLPAKDENPYLLPGRRKGGHLVNIDIAWGRIRKAAGVEDLRLHDLRRTVGSWLSQNATDLNTIKEALRHAKIETTLTYARLGADPAREAMEEHGRRVQEVAGGFGIIEGAGK